MKKDYFAFIPVGSNIITQADVSGCADEEAGRRNITYGTAADLGSESKLKFELEDGQEAVVWKEFTPCKHNFEERVFSPEFAFRLAMDKIGDDFINDKLTAAECFAYRVSLPGYQISDAFVKSESFEDGIRQIMNDMIKKANG